MRKEAAARPAAARVGAVAPIGEEIALRLRHKGVALCRLYASPGSFAWECKPATLSRKRGGRNKTVLAAHRLRPRLVHHAATKQKATKLCLPRKRGKRSAERRIVQSMSASSAAARCSLAARRLSALTLAALATGFYPDGSAPEPGFPRLD
jgi:hypothetical protein